MKWRKVAGLLLAVMLAFSSFALAPVPSAKAATLYSLTTVPVYWQTGTNDSGMSLFLGTSVGANYTYRDVATITKTLTVDGVPYTNFEWGMNVDPVQDGILLIHNFFVVFGLGVHTLVWNCDSNPGPWEMNYTSQIALNIVSMPPVSWAPIGSGVYTPFSVALAGPASIDKSLGGTWTASASSGIGPYTYLWDYRSTEAYLNYGTGAFAGSSFHRVLDVGRWFVGVQATDSKGATATATLAVSSGSAVGAYSLRFTRYGDYGRFIDVTAWDVAGQALEITGSSATEASLSSTDGQFGWTVIPDAESVQGSWAWRYTVVYTVYETISPPPAMFWLKGSITLASGVVLSFKHEFLAVTEDYSTFFGSDGNPVLPETPPVPLAKEPEWLVWLISKFKAMSIALFVPQKEDINRLLPTSYLVSEWCPIGPNTFANMTSDETFTLPVFGALRFDLDEVPSGIWTACRVFTQVSISWSLIWVMLGIIG